jgi:putative protease
VQIKLELLAPAKNTNIGIAAIDCGADALYIAGPAFGAREAAGNSIEDIGRLAEYAHKYSAKVYLALNTIIYEKEITQAVKIAREAVNAGADALIIQDLGLLKAGLPDIPLHASTQTNIRTPEQARFLTSLGFERLILARELSARQIAEIKSSTEAEIEFFIHGALCVSYSGQCYLSDKISGRSANRGECMQACRLRFDLIDGNGKILLKDKPILSLKDLNLENDIPLLAKAGVTSFKIEGRLKNASYIKNIVRHYRDKIDEFIAGNPLYVKSSYGSLYGGFVPNPDYTFNRGYTSLFISGERGQWNSNDSAKGKGERAGIVSEVMKDKTGNLIFDFKADVQINNGDGLFFVTPSGEEKGARAAVAEGQRIFTNERIEIEPGSVIYRNFNKEFERQLEKNMPERLLKVSAMFMCRNGKITLNAACEDGRRVLIESEGEFETPKNEELAKKNIISGLSKKTEHYLFDSEIDDSSETPFLVSSFINGLRRDAAKELSLQMVPKTEGRVCKALFMDGTIFPESGAADYRLNIANHYAREIYEEAGVERAGNAYEIDHPQGAELMRTKYCIKYELGICPKDGKENSPGPYWLVNGNLKFRVEFDCKKCEMIIKG